MSLLKYFTAVLVISASVLCNDVSKELNVSTLTPQSNHTDELSTTTEIYKSTTDGVERAEIYVLYETLCPFSVMFFKDDLEPVIHSMSEYIKLYLYPYGNAETEEKDGKFVTSCQHEEPECYGNKLHACAFDILKNETQSALYAICMMTGYSDDSAATECGETMNIESAPIIKCAKSYKGEELLKYYGDLSRKRYYRGVPFVIINGKKSKREDFLGDVCDAFQNQPPPCKARKVASEESSTETTSTTDRSTTTESNDV